MSDATRMYAVPLAAHEMFGVDVGSICWGECGKGSIGGIDLGEDSAIPCFEAECPYLDKQMDKPSGTVEFGGEEQPVYLRRINAARARGEVTP
jgi:hypothetical protein